METKKTAEKKRGIKEVGRMKGKERKENGGEGKAE